MSPLFSRFSARRVRLFGGLEASVLWPDGDAPVLFAGRPEVSLSECAAWLTDHSREERIRIECVVSDAWARYAVVPWSANIRSERERDALARIVLEPLTSPKADGWSVICGGPPAGRAATLACALPDSLLGMFEGLADHRIRLSTTTPLFMQVFNRARRSLPGTALLALRGWDQFTIVVIEEGQWRSVRAHPLPAGAGDAEKLMMRAAAVHGLDRSAHVFFADVSAVPLDLESVDTSAWHVLPDLSDLHWLPGAATEMAPTGAAR